MPSLGNTTFTGQSGKKYRFKVFPLGTRFRKISGIYVVANRGRANDGRLRHKVVYVGHTEDFSEPMRAHRKADAFAAHGANCICVQSDELEASRVEKELDLVAALSPQCND